jgi:hypothetical protein
LYSVRRSGKCATSSTGRVYASLEAKQAVVDASLQEMAADLERVRRHCGWYWLLEALAHLPARTVNPAK